MQLLTAPSAVDDVETQVELVMSSDPSADALLSSYDMDISST
jgi:hypothetical protein